MRPIALLLLAVGCHADNPVVPDAMLEPDTPPQQHGVSVTWHANPALPGPVTDRITVTEATFQLEHFQLLSDFGADNRTTRTRYQLAWNAAGAPEPEEFPEAPAGVYQRVLIDMRANGIPSYSYEIRGTWRDGDELKPFRVVDRQQLEARIDCSANLPAGGSTDIALRLDLRNALGRVDWERVPKDGDGVLTLNGGMQLGTLHDDLEDAFEIDN